MSDLAPETLAQMLTRTRARLTTFGDSCTESVVRRGRGEPCGKPAVALRDDREFDVYSPVCARHTRGFCIPVMDRADMHALLDAATERDALAADADRWQRAARTLLGDRYEAAIKAASHAMSRHWRAMHTNEALGLQRMLAAHALAAVLPDLLAAAWDEGHADGLHDAHEYREHRKARNPYRPETTAGDATGAPVAPAAPDATSDPSSTLNAR